MDLIGLAIGLLSGAAGGNVAGKVMNSKMGTMGRSVTGILGGAGLAAVSQYIPGLAGLFSDPTAGGGLNLSSILGGAVSGGVGGTVLTAILGKVMK